MTPIEQAGATIAASSLESEIKFFSASDQKQVLRISDKGIHVPDGVEVNEAAQAVLEIVDRHIKQRVPDHSELIARLRYTASKGISVWGDLMIEAADALEGKK